LKPGYSEYKTVLLKAPALSFVVSASKQFSKIRCIPHRRHMHLNNKENWSELSIEITGEYVENGTKLINTM
jgi:hypothetical protein